MTELVKVNKQPQKCCIFTSLCSDDLRIILALRFCGLENQISSHRSVDQNSMSNCDDKTLQDSRGSVSRKSAQHHHTKITRFTHTQSKQGFWVQWRDEDEDCDERGIFVHPFFLLEECEEEGREICWKTLSHPNHDLYDYILNTYRHL